MEAGEEKFALNGRTMANEEAGSTSIETTLPGDAPFFAALQKADQVHGESRHQRHHLSAYRRRPRRPAPGVQETLISEGNRWPSR